MKQNFEFRRMRGPQLIPHPVWPRGACRFSESYSSGVDDTWHVYFMGLRIQLL